MKASEYIADLFACRETLHKMHLSTQSYSQHKALGDAYETIGDYLDSFVERYQGFYGDLVSFDSTPPVDYQMDPIVYIEEIINKLNAARNEFSIDSNFGFFVNDIDEVIGKMYHTIYKLKFLK